MKSLDELTKMVETNEVLFGLEYDHFFNFVQNTEERLRTLPDDVSVSPVEDSMHYVIPPKDASRIGKVYGNILELALTRDEDCLKSCENYVKRLDEVLDTYPAGYELLTMPDGVAELYSRITIYDCSNDFERGIYIKIKNIKSKIYKQT